MFHINNNREIQNKHYEISPHTHRMATIKYINNKKQTKATLLKDYNRIHNPTMNYSQYLGFNPKLLDVK